MGSPGVGLYLVAELDDDGLVSLRGQVVVVRGDDFDGCSDVDHVHEGYVTEFKVVSNNDEDDEADGKGENQDGHFVPGAVGDKVFEDHAFHGAFFKEEDDVGEEVFEDSLKVERDEGES